MQDTPQVNPKKLFVGNLPYSATEQDITDLFAQHGTIVSVKLVIDRMSGRSRGIAFVEFEEDAMATAAIEALNGFEMDGRAIIVNVARPQEKRPYSGGSSSSYRGNNNNSYNNRNSHNSGSYNQDNNRY